MDDILKFIDYIKNENECNNVYDRVILLGDVIDFWRSDPIEGLIKSVPFFTGLIKAGFKEIDYILGNHDHYILRCMNREKPTLGISNLPLRMFYPYLLLKDNNKEILFTHGHELEFIDMGISEKLVYAIYDLIYRNDPSVINTLDRVAYEPLSYLKNYFENLGKKIGVLGTNDEFNEIEKLLKIEKNKIEDTAHYYDLGYDEMEKGIIDLMRNEKVRDTLFRPVWENPRAEINQLQWSARKILNLSKELVKKPAQQLYPYIPDAYRGNSPDIVVFGHTHEYMNLNKVKNTGCWIKKTGHYNTFGTVDNGEVGIYKFATNKDSSFICPL